MILILGGNKNGQEKDIKKASSIFYLGMCGTGPKSPYLEMERLMRILRF